MITLAEEPAYFQTARTFSARVYIATLKLKTIWQVFKLLRRTNSIAAIDNFHQTTILLRLTTAEEMFKALLNMANTQPLPYKNIGNILRERAKLWSYWHGQGKT